MIQKKILQIPNMNLTKTFLLTLAFNGAIAVYSFIRTKYLAYNFGLDEVGYISQLFQIQLIFTTLCALSLGPGLINAIKNETTKEGKQSALSTALAMQACSSIIFFFALLIFSKDISFFSFGNDAHSLDIKIVALSIPLLVLGNNHFISILTAFDRFDHYLRASIYSTIAALIVFVVLVSQYPFLGVVFSIFSNALILFLYLLKECLKELRWKEIFQIKLYKPYVYFFTKFGGALFTTYLLSYGTQFLIRRNIVVELGLAQNGIFQVPIALSAYYMPIFQFVIFGSLYPRIIGKSGKDVIYDFQKTTMNLSHLFCIGALALVLVKTPLVKLMLSAEFVQATPLVSEYLMGDFFHLINFGIGIYLLSQKRLKPFVVGHFILYGFYILFCVLFLKSQGLEILPKLWLSINFGLCLIALIYLKYRKLELFQLRTYVTYISLFSIIFLQVFLVDHLHAKWWALLLLILYAAPRTLLWIRRLKN